MRGLVCLTLLAGAGHANALVIDFESVPATGTCLPLLSSPLTTQGFVFSTLLFFSCDGSRGDLASNGTNTVAPRATWIHLREHR